MELYPIFAILGTGVDVVIMNAEGQSENWVNTGQTGNTTEE